MKKLVTVAALAVSTLMVFSMAGCSVNIETKNTPTESTETVAPKDMTIDGLYDEGYRIQTSSLSDEDGTWKAYYVKDDNWSNPYLVEAPMTQEEVNEIYEAPFEEDAKELLSSKEDLTITNVSDQVPDKKEFDKYVGKKLSDLQAEGYEVSGYTDRDNDNVVVEFSKPGEYGIAVKLNEKMSFDDFGADNVDYSKLTVKDAEFAGFSLE